MVTAFRVPDGVAAEEIRRQLRAEHGVVLAGGQGELAGKILRIGHLGYVDTPDLVPVMAALRTVLEAGRPIGARS